MMLRHRIGWENPNRNQNDVGHGAAQFDLDSEKPNLNKRIHPALIFLTGESWFGFWGNPLRRLR
jgi:hypothetical protein